MKASLSDVCRLKELKEKNSKLKRMFTNLYVAKTRDDSPIIEGFSELAHRYPRYAFGKLFALLRRYGFWGTINMYIQILFFKAQSSP
jgi:hypothetical protein